MAKRTLQEGLLSVIIRCHDPDRMHELKRCLFSIYNATHSLIQPVVVCQDFSEAARDYVRSYAGKLARINPHQALVVDFRTQQPGDHRSHLANAGMLAASGQYIAFLDYDDCIYPEAYELLIARLIHTASAIAFGGIAQKNAFVQDGITLVRSKQKKWGARNIFDLLHDNCSPIHSYVVDRLRLIQPHPLFDESLSKYEDYDFLINICTQYASDFEEAGRMLGDYYIKEDGSNSVITASSYSGAAHTAWQDSKKAVIKRRDSVVLSSEVLSQLRQALASHNHPNALTSGATVADVNSISKPVRKIK